jgi:hypothetical protein
MHEPRKPEFRFKLNGIIISEIRIQRALVNGQPIGELQIAVNESSLGWFSLDNNENLWDEALPKFSLEYRDQSAWALLPTTERCASKDKGWHRTTPEELIGILYSSGVIE